VRQVLAYATDKKKVNEAGTYGAGIVIDSPILLIILVIIAK